MKIIETKDAQLMAKLSDVMQNKHQELYPDFFKPYNEKEILHHFQETFKNPKQQVFLWIDDQQETEQIAAYLWLEEEALPETVYRYGYTRLYVHHVLIMPAYQGKGLSKELLAFADNFAKERAITNVELHYWSQNEIAKNVYSQFGYEVYTEIAYKQIANH
ncbi:GNAT family N-acetyltransferase [Carnobacterium jeotgali]|uniref:GNAT family N-acetyltransferase n=1 Tax=Carnobacterium jeotgali TaxID=545534 RepID=UPI00388F4F2E